LKKREIDEAMMRDIVNFELRHFDADYDKVKKFKKFNGIDWYEWFWDDAQSKAEWLKFTRDYLKKNCLLDKKGLNRYVATIDLYLGLKVY